MLYDKSKFLIKNENNSVILTAYLGNDPILSIPDSITHIGEAAFFGCGSIKQAVIPNSVLEIDSHAFSNCWNLTHLSIADSVINIGDYAFSNC